MSKAKSSINGASNMSRKNNNNAKKAMARVGAAAFAISRAGGRRAAHRDLFPDTRPAPANWL